jgi:hypothetical protein
MPIGVVSGVHFLEGMFIAGTLGSVVVLALSGIEDIERLFSMDIGMEKEKRTS